MAIGRLIMFWVLLACVGVGFFVGLVLTIAIKCHGKMLPYPSVFINESMRGHTNYASSGGGSYTSSQESKSSRLQPGSAQFIRIVNEFGEKKKIIHSEMGGRRLEDRLDFVDLEINDFKGHEYLIGWDETGVKPERESKE